MQVKTCVLSFGVKGEGHAGRVKRTKFAMASGELSRADFVEFLKSTLAASAAVSRDGAVHFVCMDWRHIGELLEAGGAVYGDVLNLAVWVKSNAGQGAFYRSQHELIGVFHVGEEPHLNNVELGRHGRSRSNVWQSHPTVQPVELVADAMKDCTRRGDIVLDTFSGFGTTILKQDGAVGAYLSAVKAERASLMWLQTALREALQPRPSARYPFMVQ